MAAEMMKTFVMKRTGEVGFVSKPVPKPGPNDAVIRTTRALVCTSDVHTVKGAIGDRTDLTLGHEAVGVVHALGSAVCGLEKGDRVAVNAITPCFRCDNCLRGFTSHCQQMLGGWKFANVKDGTFAEYFHVNDAEAKYIKSITLSYTFHVTDLPSDQASLADPGVDGRGTPARHDRCLPSTIAARDSPAPAQ